MKKFTAEQQAIRAYDAYMIKNLMGRHAYYHAWSMHPEEYENCWSEREDIAWGNNAGYHIGRECFYNYYVKPQVGTPPEPGVLFMHTLTTPLIEVADDGQTAQAMWYTPGYGCGPDGSMNWMYERYAVDFIKEKGQWKIWHLFVGTDFSFALGAKLSDPRPGFGPPTDAGDKAPEPGVLKLDGISDSRFGWPAFPPLPKAYAAFAETVSYGPESFIEKEGK